VRGAIPQGVPCLCLEQLHLPGHAEQHRSGLRGLAWHPAAQYDLAHRSLERLDALAHGGGADAQNVVPGLVIVQDMVSVFTSGVLTGLALIVAIGAQNAFVLRQGVRREHVGLVVAVCMASDAALILGGTAGIGALVAQFPGVLEVLRWCGAAYLIWWAIRSFRSAFKASTLAAVATRSRGSVLATTLALTFLNPHVYLDTVVLLGSLANQHGDDARWAFAAGAVVGSVLWFTALGYGASKVSGLLSSPRTWRVLDVVIGFVMLAIAVRLLLH
jgi:L-lysine exporter family protein LysE/ArgO